MADGRRLNTNADVAASKTLPLGTTATVTNLNNGRTAKVTIEDRGPYINGRIIDVTPKVAGDLGFRGEGTAPVVVQPLIVPGAGRTEQAKSPAGRDDQEVAEATPAEPDDMPSGP